ncbi:MAG: glycogen/starch synthase, partial [Actinomycetota bacterium]|nr:glycogen/starch synthase [Actinomycetota bacterium]
MSTDTSPASAEPRLRLTFVASELAPLVQTGGLGDAVSGLAHALAERGHAIDCILPAHRAALTSPLGLELEETGRTRLEGLGHSLDGRWLTGRLGALTIHLLDLDELFDRDTLYGGDDEGHRFAAFARAAAERCAELEPDVLVAHDWQAALSICVLRTLYDRGNARGIGTVQVVHNNAHQGRFDPSLLDVAGLPGALFAPDGLEWHGQVSLLKGGLVWADRIVAVSPSYAEELTTPEFGEGLEGLYRYRAHRLLGIANGIDAHSYDPEKDAALPAQFDRKALGGRELCREALIAELGLESPAEGWLLACIGRLAVQKGWDVLADAVPELVRRGASIVLLGDGDPVIAERIEALGRRFPGRIALETGWNDGLARRIYAGADSVLVPSRFEPCGLVQLLSQRYGALPVAHAVGGLRDTIRDDRTGILFTPLSAEALVDAVERGADLRRDTGAALTRALLRK